MDNFFKRCGIGIVVIVTSPFWLAYFALYILYATINLIISPIKLLVYALKHRNYTIKSHYDVEAEARLNAANNPQPNFVSPFNNMTPNNGYYPNQTVSQQPLNISINLVNPNQNNNQDFNNQNGYQQNINLNQPNQNIIDYSNLNQNNQMQDQNNQLTNNNPVGIENNNNNQVSPSYNENGGVNHE